MSHPSSSTRSSTSPSPTDEEVATTVVRPRWTWAGVALVVVGVALLGTAVILTTVPVAAVGGVLVLAGLGAGWRGNLYRDARAHASPHQVVEAVAEGGEVEIRDPGSRVKDADVRQHALEADAARKRVASQSRERTELAPLGIALMVVVAAWLAISQVLLPFTVTGKDVGLSDVAVAVPLALAAFALRNRGGHVLAWSVCVLAGIVLILLATLGSHSTDWSPWSQGISGVLVLAGAALASARQGAVTVG